MVREVLECTETAVREHPVVRYLPQFFAREVQIRAVFPARCLVGQMREAFEPELAGAGNLVALLRENHREETGGEVGISPYLRRDPQQEARLAAAARAENELVNVRVSRTLANYFHERFELAGPHAE